MKSKKQKPVKKYVVGGAIAAQAGIAGLQALLGGGQLLGGTAMANKLKAPSTATPSAWKDFYESAQNQALVQQNIDQINRASATYLQALQTGGSQAVAAGLQPLAMGTQEATQDVYNQQIAREQNAALSIAGAEERALGRERDVYEARLGEAQAARSAGIQNVFGALGSAGKGIVDLTAGQPESQKRKQKITDVAPLEETSFIEQVNLQPAGGMVKPMSKIPSLVDNDELLKRALEMSRFAFEDGGMVTGGKFDHSTNPIDIVKKGKKIGEMTGGEVILNPAQQKKLSKESVYFRQLLKKFNKQK